ncbi:hypothetical protein F511_39034 [Dorcoceras hygrometricum]|uniref:Uncharacterized protein n=1 Tax=Dorcoceras hygrometricum TaxID=472368 RepID=A0A2Z7D7I9_9LAMI|nr:hypothetical protein F511_39034 [Dorcoceras hygrometricum]
MEKSGLESAEIRKRANTTTHNAKTTDKSAYVSKSDTNTYRTTNQEGAAHVIKSGLSATPQHFSCHASKSDHNPQYTKTDLICDSGFDDYHEAHIIVTVYSKQVLSRLVHPQQGYGLPEFETSICGSKYHGSFVEFPSGYHLLSELSPRFWLYKLVLITQNIIETIHYRFFTLTVYRIRGGHQVAGLGEMYYTAIESMATLDFPMIVDSIGIFELKGSYYMLAITCWFLQTNPRSSLHSTLPPRPHPLGRHSRCHRRAFPREVFHCKDSVHGNLLTFVLQVKKRIGSSVVVRIRRSIVVQLLKVHIPLGLVGAGREVT